MTATRPDGARRLGRGSWGAARAETVERRPGRPGALAGPWQPPQPRPRDMAHPIERDPTRLELLAGGLIGFAVLLLLCIAIPLGGHA